MMTDLLIEAKLSIESEIAERGSWRDRELREAQGAQSNPRKEM